MLFSKLTVPVMLLGPLFAAAAGAGGSWMVTKEQVKQIQQSQETTQAQVENLKEKQVDHAMLDGKIIQALEDLKSDVHEIKTEMRRK
jgi:uncharacterized protein HemX